MMKRFLAVLFVLTLIALPAMAEDYQVKVSSPNGAPGIALAALAVDAPEQYTYVAADRGNAAKKFMARYKRGLAESRHAVPSPESGDAVMSLDISGTDTAGFNLDQHLSVLQSWDGYFLQTVLIPVKGHNRFHGLIHH